MICDQIYDIPNFASSRRRNGFVEGEVNRMQSVTRCFIADRWEKSVVAVHDPLQARYLAAFADLRAINRRELPKPCNGIAGLCQYICVSHRRFGNALFTIMENINVAGVP